jgi:hypothetical protein
MRNERVVYDLRSHTRGCGPAHSTGSPQGQVTRADVCVDDCSLRNGGACWGAPYGGRVSYDTPAPAGDTHRAERTLSDVFAQRHPGRARKRARPIQALDACSRVGIPFATTRGALSDSSMLT